MAITLLEGFELISGSNPWVSTYNWNDFNGSGITVTRTTANVTQGTYTWRVQNPTIDSNIGLSAGTDWGDPLDLSAYSTLELDIFSATLPVNSFIALYIYDNISYTIVGDTTPLGFTGSTTLSIDLLTSGVDLSVITIMIVASDGGISTPLPFDFYIDNLRADDGASGGTPIPVFYNHMKTQGMA